jgi:hypothetical protein
MRALRLSPGWPTRGLSGLGRRTAWRWLGGNRQGRLTLQLHLLFPMRALRGGLMGTPPQRPGNDQRWLNAPLRQTHGDAANLLHGPTSQGLGCVCVTLAADFFLAPLLARWRIVVSMAKASITIET